MFILHLSWVFSLLPSEQIRVANQTNVIPYFDQITISVCASVAEREASLPALNKELISGNIHWYQNILKHRLYFLFYFWKQKRSLANEHLFS